MTREWCFMVLNVAGRTRAQDNLSEFKVQTGDMTNGPNLGTDLLDSSIKVVKAFNSEVPTPSPGPPRLVKAPDAVHPLPQRGEGSSIAGSISAQTGLPTLKRID